MEIELKRTSVAVAPAHEILRSRHIIVFSDLDSTLLDHQTYSFSQAKSAMRILQEKNISINIVASKTKAEIEAIELKMGIFKSAPFIVENGGAIYIPNNYFNFNIKKRRPNLKIYQNDSFTKIEFGKSYKEVRKALKTAAKKTGLKVVGIGDMTDEEFTKDSGLSLKAAHRAKMREYQEGFRIDVPLSQLAEAQSILKKEIEAMGFFMSRGGRYFQIMGFPAKVQAIQTLIELYQIQYPDIFTVGLGDAQADLKFLELCDVGYLIFNPHNSVALENIPVNIRRISSPGPEGWSEAIMNFLEENLPGDIKNK